MPTLKLHCRRNDLQFYFIWRYTICCHYGGKRSGISWQKKNRGRKILLVSTRWEHLRATLNHFDITLNAIATQNMINADWPNDRKSYSSPDAPHCAIVSTIPIAFPIGCWWKKPSGLINIDDVSVIFIHGISYTYLTPRYKCVGSFLKYNSDARRNTIEKRSNSITTRTKPRFSTRERKISDSWLRIFHDCSSHGSDFRRHCKVVGDVWIGSEI